MGMVGTLGLMLLDISCVLSRPIPGWGKSLDQGIYTNMDDSTEAREGSFCKSQGGKKYEKTGRQGINHGMSDTRTGVLILCN